MGKSLFIFCLSLLLSNSLNQIGDIPKATQSHFECPQGTVHRREKVSARGENDPFFPEFAQFEEYCQRKREDGKSVKEGPYVRWGPNGEKQLAGQYVDGRKEGKWIRTIPSQILEDNWQNGKYVGGKILGEPHSYVIDFEACIPHGYGIPAAFGSTSYRLLGKQRRTCRLTYSKYIEMGQGPLVSCLVPTTNKKLVFGNTSMGLDFTSIKQYCKTGVRKKVTLIYD